MLLTATDFPSKGGCRWQRRRLLLMNCWSVCHCLWKPSVTCSFHVLLICWFRGYIISGYALQQTFCFVDTYAHTYTAEATNSTPALCDRTYHGSELKCSPYNMAKTETSTTKTISLCRYWYKNILILAFSMFNYCYCPPLHSLVTYSVW
jgi:hypothetical protein